MFFPIVSYSHLHPSPSILTTLLFIWTFPIKSRFSAPPFTALHFTSFQFTTLLDDFHFNSLHFYMISNTLLSSFNSPRLSLSLTSYVIPKWFWFLILAPEMCTWFCLSLIQCSKMLSRAVTSDCNTRCPFFFWGGGQILSSAVLILHRVYRYSNKCNVKISGPCGLRFLRCYAAYAGSFNRRFGTAYRSYLQGSKVDPRIWDR